MLVPMKIDYGVRILVHLALLPMDSIVKGAKISQERHIPEKFLFQISNELAERVFGIILFISSEFPNIL